MTATAAAQSFVTFLSPDLLATRNPNTARVCAETWQGKLEMGLHAALQLAHNLRSEIAEGAPRHETIVALYGKLLSLSSVHQAQEAIAINGKVTEPAENALGKPLAQAAKTAGAWYLNSLKSQNLQANGKHEKPTAERAQALCETLETLTTLDMKAVAKPHIDRYNARFKPGQVFKTPLELYAPGGPLAWQTGSVNKAA